ncbi:Chitinase [Ktedonobacteria bacterium brp13]|nr:Chitinase [Ktedonobacteria bacterium brp13]
MTIPRRFFSIFLKASTLVLACTLALGGLGLTRIIPAHAASSIPSSYFAPYAELGQGASLQSVTQSTGQKYYTLAFMLGNGCTAEWNGTVPLSQDTTYFPSLNSDIQYVRSQGGDVIVSFGGAAGQELAQTCSTASALQAQYQAVINHYNLTHLDFDIEGGQQGDSTTYDRRNTALAALQAANPGLTISFTLPSGTTGLLSDSLGLLNNAVSHGVNFNVVNLMTMDYGSADSQMGQESINAANGLYSELQAIFPSKTSSQLWSMVGITSMIGQNDTPGEIFSLGDASQVLSFAQSHAIGELAFWAVSRDNGSCPGATPPTSDTCSGISQGTYDFINSWKSFSTTGGGTPNAPIGKTIWLRAYTGSYASARTDQTNSPLDANVTQVQAWEEFDVLDAGNGLIALRAHANGNYVSTRIDQTNSPLEAVATQIQGWEEFTWLPQSNGTVALQAQANGDYVSARTDQTNTPLEAEVTQIQGWELFQWGLVGQPANKQVFAKGIITTQMASGRDSTFCYEWPLNYGLTH